MSDENNKNLIDTSETDKITELEKKAEEYLNNWKRSAADFINYKKGEIERAGMLVKYSKEDVLLSILPILDSIYLLDKHAKVEGIELIKKQIEEFLKKQGIEEIKTEGEQFNAETMEALGEVESAASAEASASQAGAVAEELQKGYTMDNRVIRVARVKVYK